MGGRGDVSYVHVYNEGYTACLSDGESLYMSIVIADRSLNFTVRIAMVEDMSPFGYPIYLSKSPKIPISPSNPMFIIRTLLHPSQVKRRLNSQSPSPMANLTS